jgi:hypothetical protein
MYAISKMDINKTRSITSFISSKNRQSQENTYDFTIDYPDGILTCRPNEYMELNVLSFDMPNTMYNINKKNNEFDIITPTETIRKTIPEGNYSIKTFMTQLNNLIGNEFITITYNEAQNTYTFFKSYELIDIYKIKSISIGQLIGVMDNVEYEIKISGFTTGLINLINYNKVIVRTENISYYYSNVENIRTNTNNSVISSDIIFWKSKADIEPYKILKYNNEDGGNSFVYKIENRQINSIVFLLRNERNEIIYDAPDYMIVIQYNFYEKQDIKKILNSIDNTMKELYNTILFSISRLKLLL